jgi:hypothetical protein
MKHPPKPLEDAGEFRGFSPGRLVRCALQGGRFEKSRSTSTRQGFRPGVQRDEQANERSYEPLDESEIAESLK